MTKPPDSVARIGPGRFWVQHGDRSDIVYVAGRGAGQWIFWNGHVFQSRTEHGSDAATRVPRAPRAGSAQTLTAPMPARVVKVLVHPGDSVRKGDTLVLLEAMKMELPVRALDNANVTNVYCRDGELVQAEAPLVDLR